MKKLVGIITVLALFTSVASAELLKNFKANGSLEVLSMTANNASDFDADANDKFSQTEARVIVGATFDLNDDVDAKVTLMKSDRQYNSAAGNVQNVTNIQGAFNFMEAYINLKAVLGMDHRIGKQQYGTPGDLVVYFGPSGWYVRGLGVGSAVDGWSATYKKDKLTIGALSAKVVEGAGLAMNDTDLYGVTAAYDFGYEYLNPSFYYYQGDDRTAAGVQDKVTVMGLKANGKFMGFNYGAEYAMNGGGDNSNAGTGNNENYTGTLMALNANYDLDAGFGKFNFMGRQIIGSGDKATVNKDDETFQDINANFRPGLILGGSGVKGAMTDITSPANLTVTILGANFTPNAFDGKLNLDAKMYNSKYTEATNDGIGTELDLVASWMHSDDVCLKLALASFTPDSDYAVTATKEDSVYLMNFYLNVKF
jgi:Gram-negative porin